jgi:hypothetical protein
MDGAAITAGARAERRAKALQLRKSGYMLKVIAAKLGISVPTAYRDVARELLAVELLRLDELQTGLYASAVAGKVVAIDRLLNIMDKRARLLWLYGPSSRLAPVEVSMPWAHRS